MELRGDQISLHSLEHVLVLALGKLFELVLFNQRVQEGLILGGSTSLNRIELSQVKFLLTSLLESSLGIIELLLFSLDSLVNLIILLPKDFKSL